MGSAGGAGSGGASGDAGPDVVGPGCGRDDPMPAETAAALSFARMWAALEPVGRHSRTGGYQRFAWSAADLECREWFRAEAASRSMDCHTDRNGNLWAWWRPGGDRTRGAAFATGSHLDSAADGGAFAGALGVVSAFAAVDLLRARGTAVGHPVAVVAFTGTEGSRFPAVCIGSRLAVGSLSADTARGLRDENGSTLAEAMTRAGHDPSTLGRDIPTLRQIGMFVELHVEQGRVLAEAGSPVAVASGISARGWWRFVFTGAADHAGTSRLVDRRDPMLTCAMTVLAARKAAAGAGCLATFGRVLVEPNAVTTVPSRVSAWLDVRGADVGAVQAVASRVEQVARGRAGRDGTTLAVQRGSLTPAVRFPARLRQSLRGRPAAATGSLPNSSSALPEWLPELGTGAGHDAGVLAGELPTAMLFVRSTGVSHAPGEFAEQADCMAGVRVLAEAMTRGIDGH